METNCQTREIRVDEIRADEKSRTVELSFSSDAPIERYGGLEILDHTASAVDLSRLNNGGAVLVDHDPTRQVAVIERAWTDGKKGHAKIRFSKNPLASEIFQDVKDSIRQLVSVGYRILKTAVETSADGVQTIRATKWTPYEISFTSIPADTTVGVGRSFNIMNNTIDPNSARIEEINAYVDNCKDRIPAIVEIGSRAILSGASVEQFRAEALRAIPKQQPIRQFEPLQDVSAKDWSQYSLARALVSKCRDGFEREMSDELTRQGGQAAQGFWVPTQALVRNFVAGTATLGGNLVQTTNAADMFVEMLRNKAQVLNLGATVLNLNGPTTIPRQNGAGNANWVGETVSSTLSTGNFNQLTLTPNCVTANMQYSKQLLVTGNPSIDAIIRSDITAQLGLAIDLAALHGTGGDQPTGIAGTTGIGTVNLATNGLALGNTTAYPFLISLTSTVASANADNGSLGFLVRAGHAAALQTAQRFSGTDSPVFQRIIRPDGSSQGSIAGFRAEVSQQISTILTTGTATTTCSAIFYGNFADLIVATFGQGLDLVCDEISLAQNRVVKLLAHQYVTIGVRRPASFCIGGGILTT